MCAIAGSIAKEDTRKMLEFMKHRAPDGVGFFDTPKYSLGMGRLAIIDLTSKNLCPYTFSDYTISFNGEVYNYIELREELKKLGYKFETQSDIEVALKSYIQWGKACFDKFNGMFALAILGKGEIILARDCAGEKPLYYTENPFRFASEAKVLGFDCKEMPKAAWLTYNLKTKEIVTREYWLCRRRNINPETADQELEELLRDSIRLRTRSDVPYGLYFSGGIDSSLISLMHDFEYQFTYHDSPNHKEFFLKDFPKILWHLDYPITSFSPYGLWRLAYEAKNKGVKVVLSGEGADELFGGYVRYVPQSMMREGQIAYPSYMSMFPYEKTLNQMSWEEFNGNMQHLLRMGDRMASAFGIENRCPFLDKRIIEFAYSLPQEEKIKGTATKVILRKILKRLNPDYQFPEKHGLYCSVNEWLGVKDKFDKTKYLEYQNELYKTICNNPIVSKA